MSHLDRIKQRVLGKEQKDDFFVWADIFMHEYGMNFEDFKRLNIQAFYLLKNKMQKRYDEMNKAMKNKRGRR